MIEQEFSKEELELEEWKDLGEVEGFEDYKGLYAISSLGRIKSLEKTVITKQGAVLNYPERIMSVNFTTRGYVQVSLCKNNKKHSYRIHQIVGRAFVPNPNNLLEINHKDENKTNNRISNLEWCDRSYNINYGTANKRRARPGETNGNWKGGISGKYIRKENSIRRGIKKRVLCLETKEVFNSMDEAKEYYGCNNISQACKDKWRVSGGYHWRIIEEGQDIEDFYKPIIKIRDCKRFMKTCSCCGELKIITKYNKSKTGKDGHEGQCQKCKWEKAKARKLKRRGGKNETR